jgi:hypothetical protein
MPIPMQVLHHRRVRERGGGGEDERLRGEVCKREGGRMREWEEGGSVLAVDIFFY